MEEHTMWMVRAGEGARLIDEFRKENVVAIGWGKLGDLSKFKEVEEIKDIVAKEYSDLNKNQLSSSAGQVVRFRFHIKKGDKVLSYDSAKRVYLVGEVQSDYKYDATRKEYKHFHDVHWLGEVSRDKLSTSTKNSLGAISTIFEINDIVEREIMTILQGKELETDALEIDEESDTKEDMESKAYELIKDKLINLTWDDMEKFVAGILKAMGYKALLTERGADRGKDIEASPDGLMLEEPRIIAEVKHRSGSMGSKDIRNFISVLRERHKGIYVSTGGFSKEAKSEAERANVQVTLVDLDRLVKLIVDYYDNFDTDTKLLLPLTKIYWPS